MIKYTLLVLAASILMISGSYGATCPRYVAPAVFNNKPSSWGNDSGPIVDGFVDVRSSSGSLLDLVHGVDLSHYNFIDYSRLKECGGSFAFVQMDSYFAHHYTGLAMAGVTAIPYSFLHLPSSLRLASHLPITPSIDQVDELRKIYAAAGRSAAEQFLHTVKKVTGAHPIPDVSLAGLEGRFVAVDVEEAPLDLPSSRSAQRYGQFYAVAVCSWVNTVAADPEMGNVVPILYTFPAIYGQYLTYAFPEENRCLQGLPVWIARTFPDGGEAVHDPRAIKTVDQYVQRLCLVQGGNRCLVHQYTHRGTFMSAVNTSKSVPPHFDLDRFYSSKLERTDAEPQYVRAVNPFVP